MENNKILLISDNNGTTKLLTEKLVLLRRYDTVVHCSNEKFAENLQEYAPTIVFLVENEDRELTVQNLDLIKKYYNNTSVIFVALKKDYDFVLLMYDMGANDFIFQDSSSAEILIKTINAIKLTSLSVNHSQNRDLLKITKLISNSGFYTEECANELMLASLDEPCALNSSFMILACDELDRGKYKSGELIDAIKKSIRNTDIVIELKSEKFYIYLRNTNEEGAVTVFRKIKEEVSGIFRIKAGISKVYSRSFRDLEQMASIALTDAMLGTVDTVIYKEKPEESIDEWLLEPEDNQKDFKLFKQVFLKKLNGIITPVFYRFQTSYESILKDTKIEQYSHETQCIFHLKNNKQTSRLTIVYPGFAKIVIYETHSGWDSPENKEIFLPLNKLTERTLSEILEEFINNFKSCINE